MLDRPEHTPTVPALPEAAGTVQRLKAGQKEGTDTEVKTLKSVKNTLLQRTTRARQVKMSLFKNQRSGASASFNIVFVYSTTELFDYSSVFKGCLFQTGWILRSVVTEVISVIPSVIKAEHISPLLSVHELNVFPSTCNNIGNKRTQLKCIGITLSGT